jgi:hypothetical protein
MAPIEPISHIIDIVALISLSSTVIECIDHVQSVKASNRNGNGATNAYILSSTERHCAADGHNLDCGKPTVNGSAFVSRIMKHSTIYAVVVANISTFLAFEKMSAMVTIKPKRVGMCLT